MIVEQEMVESMRNLEALNSNLTRLEGKTVKVPDSKSFYVICVVVAKRG